MFESECSAHMSGARPKVRFEGFERATHLSSSGMNLWVEVTNDSCWRLVVKRAEVDILVDGVPRVTISLRDKVKIPRGDSAAVLLPLRFQTRSLFAFATILGRIATLDVDNITIGYRVRAGTTLFKRNFVQKDIAVTELLEALSLPSSELSILVDMLNR